MPPARLLPGSGLLPPNNMGAVEVSDVGTLYFPDNLFIASPFTNQFRGRVLSGALGTWSPSSLTIKGCGVAFGPDGYSLSVANDVVVDAGGARSPIPPDQRKSGRRIAARTCRGSS